MPRFFILAVALVFCALLSADVLAQTAGQKTSDLIAALGKTKHKKKEKKGFTFETYVDMKSEPVVKNNVRDYAGVYESGDDYRLELRVAADGRIEGNGHDSVFLNSQRQSFTLKDARIQGALLTATKVYAGGGRTENFEAVFNNQTITQGKNPNEISSRQTRYGLGFIYTYQSSRIDTTSRVFLEFKP